MHKFEKVNMNNYTRKVNSAASIKLDYFNKLVGEARAAKAPYIIRLCRNNINFI